MLSTNLREQSSLIARILHLVDCFLPVGYLWLLTVWYRVPWNFYYTRLSVLIFFLCFVGFQSFQLYRSWRGWKFYLEFFVIVKAWGMVVGILLFYFFIFKISHAYSRVVFLIWSLSTPFLIFSLHIIARVILRKIRARGHNLRRAVVVGAGNLGETLVREVESMPWAGIEVLGYFDDKISEEKNALVNGKPLLGSIAEIYGFLDEHDIDYVSCT